MSRISRRQLLELTAVAGATAASPSALVGCSDEGDTTTAQTDDSFEPPVFDPDQPWWLQHNYAPVGDEVEETTLEVEGALPAELTGLYVRNGSNPATGASDHWFLGDGMLHGVRLEGGSARWYRNRYLETPLYESPSTPGALSVPTLTDNASNVSLVHHAGRLLSLGEVGLPYEVNPGDLSTLGAYDFGGKLATAMTAHPKLDPETGELLFFGYWFAAPFLTAHRADSSGALVASLPIDLPASSMMHDFQVTATRMVFMDLPIVFEMAMAADGLFPYRWSDDHAARIGVLPRDFADGATDTVPVWIEVDPCYVFHTMCAYDDPSDSNVAIVEVVRYPRLWVEGPNDFDASGSLWRWRIDVVAGTITEEQIDDRVIEFPQLDPRRVGRPHRYGYSLWMADREPGVTVPAGVQGVLKYDLDQGSTSVLELAAHEQSDEMIFVPAKDGGGEDEGWLMGYVYDARRGGSDLVVVDATDLAAGPVARVKLPHRVPFGFHGVWVPA